MTINKKTLIQKINRGNYKEAKTDNLKVKGVEKKKKGTSYGAILEYEMEDKQNKVLIKERLPLNPKFMTKYEVALSHFIEDKLKMKSVKKINLSSKKDIESSVVASLWEDNLHQNLNFENIKNSQVIESVNHDMDILHRDSYLDALFTNTLNIYKKYSELASKEPNREIKKLYESQKKLYKMCTCFTACGMIDFQIGDNIMFDKNNEPVSIDTGYSIYLENERNMENWNKFIDILKTDKDKEVQGWGKEIEAFKNHTLENIFIEKQKIIIDKRERFIPPKDKKDLNSIQDEEDLTKWEEKINLNNINPIKENENTHKLDKIGAKENQPKSSKLEYSSKKPYLENEKVIIER